MKDRTDENKRKDRRSSSVNPGMFEKRVEASVHEILLRPEKFRHDRVRNLQGAMQNVREISDSGLEIRDNERPGEDKEAGAGDQRSSG